MLLAQEFATGQSGIGYTPLDWNRAVPTFAFPWSDGIIESVVVPYLQQHNTGIFQHDNARPHTARHTHNILHIHNVSVLQWPSRSPDLSPIEHLWDHFGRQVRERHDVNNIHDLELALQAELVRIHCRSLENWFAEWDVVVWQSWPEWWANLVLSRIQIFTHNLRVDDRIPE